MIGVNCALLDVIERQDVLLVYVKVLVDLKSPRFIRWMPIIVNASIDLGRINDREFDGCK